MLILKDLLYVYTTHSPSLMYNIAESNIIYMEPDSITKYSGIDRVVSELMEEKDDPIYFQLDQEQCLVPSNGLFQEDVLLSVDPSFVQPFIDEVKLWFVYDYVERKVIQMLRPLVQEWTYFISRIGKKYEKIISSAMKEYILTRYNKDAECPFRDVFNIMDEMGELYPYNSFKERLTISLMNQKDVYYCQGEGYKNQVRYLSQLIYSST